MEKLPKDYSQGKIQKVIEYLENKVARTEKKATRAYQDLSEEFTEKLSAAERKLTDKITGKDEIGKPPRTIPVPQDLTVKGRNLFVFCSVKPFTFWKYFVAGIRGYEFYGSYNQDFSVHVDDYTQTGTHYGSNGSAYLYTKDSDDDSNTFYIDHKVVKIVAANRLTLENVTQGTSGTIGTTSYLSVNKLKVSGITWNTGDVWRIKSYPSNRLYSIGPFAFHVKSFKTMSLDFYVKARTVGTGHSFSEFVSGSTAQDVETLPTPENFTATQRVRPLTGDIVYWVQDIPYVDIVLEWDDLDSEYGLITYEVKETIEGQEGEE